MVSCHTSHPDSDKGRLALNVFKPPSSNMNGKETQKKLCYYIVTEHWEFAVLHLNTHNQLVVWKMKM